MKRLERFLCWLGCHSWAVEMLIFTGRAKCTNCGATGIYTPGGEVVSVRRASKEIAAPKPKIYLYCYQAQVDGVAARAVTEDDESITGVVSSTEAWAKYDLGYTSEHQHALYDMQFPQGWELVWGRPPS